MNKEMPETMIINGTTYVQKEEKKEPVELRLEKILKDFYIHPYPDINKVKVKQQIIALAIKKVEELDGQIYVSIQQFGDDVKQGLEGM